MLSLIILINFTIIITPKSLVQQYRSDLVVGGGGGGGGEDGSVMYNAHFLFPSNFSFAFV